MTTSVSEFIWRRRDLEGLGSLDLLTDSRPPLFLLKMTAAHYLATGRRSISRSMESTDFFAIIMAYESLHPGDKRSRDY